MLIAQSEIMTEALQQTAHRNDSTFLITCVLIIVAAGGIGMYFIVSKTLNWLGTRVVEPGMEAGIAHLNRVGEHLDRVNDTLNRNTEALEAVASTLTNLQCNQSPLRLPGGNQ